MLLTVYKRVRIGSANPPLVLHLVATSAVVVAAAVCYAADECAPADAVPWPVLFARALSVAAALLSDVPSGRAYVGKRRSWL